MTWAPIGPTTHMWRLVAETGAGYVCMHMQGTPQTMQANPTYADVESEVGEFFRERLQRLSDCGVRREQIILDPGIGFGKTLEHNLQLLGALGRFTKLERPLLLGVSRKSFIGNLLGVQPAERAAGSAGVRVPGRRGAGCRSSAPMRSPRPCRR